MTSPSKPAPETVERVAQGIQGHSSTGMSEVVRSVARDAILALTKRDLELECERRGIELKEEQLMFVETVEAHAACDSYPPAPGETK